MYSGNKEFNQITVTASDEKFCLGLQNDLYMGIYYSIYSYAINFVYLILNCKLYEWQHFILHWSMNQLSTRLS